MLRAADNSASVTLPITMSSGRCAIEPRQEDDDVRVQQPLRRVLPLTTERILVDVGVGAEAIGVQCRCAGKHSHNDFARNKSLRRNVISRPMGVPLQ